MANLWQQPHVNVFKHFNLTSWKKAAKEGEVSTFMDKTVKATVVKITGHIPAGNYIQIPRTSSQSLGLTGRYFYLLFRPIPTKYFVVHVDVQTHDGLVIRLSFSNLFKEFKSTSTWLQFPFLCNPSKETVAFFTSVGAKEHGGPAPTSTRWTVLCLDLSYILSTYLNRNYAHIRSMRLCANMLVKNVFTSDILYDPEMSMAEAKKFGGGRHMAPLPREFGFPVTRGETWHDVYDLIRFPPEGKKKPFDSVQYSVDDNKDIEEDLDGRPQRIMAQTKNISKCVSERVSMIHKLTTPKEYPKKQEVTQELPELELDKDVDDSDVHIYAHPVNPDKPMAGGPTLGPKKVKEMAAAPVQQEKLKPVRDLKTLEPDPIIKLKRIVGFGGGTFRDVMWSGDRTCVIYPCHAVVVVMKISNGHQRFLIGHTDKVSCLAMNGGSTVVASGQTGQMSVVRVWKYQTGECLAICKTHAHSLYSLSFAQNGHTLCGVGKDSQGKNLVVIWNTAQVLKRREVSIIAKAHTDVDITRMIVAPFDAMRMVSCGRDNVRLWRVKDGTLRSASVNFGDYHNLEFTDICFEVGFHANRNPDERLIYACCRSGYVFEIDYQKMALHHVRRLLPIAQRVKGSTKGAEGLAITCISMNETFCATGSEDGYLRLWPLDFAHVYLEAEHEGAVTAVHLSSDGLKILAGTGTGNLGILDVSSRDYTTIMRSHTSRIMSVAIDPYRKHMATVSRDHSIRVWDAETLQQLYDFSAAEECPTTICYHPNLQVFCCGFESGAVRVFNVQSTCLVAENMCHKGAVTGVIYSPNGEYLYSACSQGSLAAYSTVNKGYPLLRLLNNMVARGKRCSPDTLTISADGRKLAFVGPTDFTVSIVDGRYLSELVRVDVTNLTPEAGKDYVDTAVHVAFTAHKVGHLLVTTSNQRLLKLDAASGKLIAEVSGIHRVKCTSLVTSKDGRYLVTAGDKVLKVWDYTMRLDINFQVFIGHCEDINKVIFVPDQSCIISAGEAIYIWESLAPQAAATPPLERRVPAIEPVRALRADVDPHESPTELEFPRRCPPKPVVPSLPSAFVEDISAINNEDDLNRTLDSTARDFLQPCIGHGASRDMSGFGQQDHQGSSTQRGQLGHGQQGQGQGNLGHSFMSDKTSVRDMEDELCNDKLKQLKTAKEKAFLKHSPHQPQPHTGSSKGGEKLLKKVPSVLGNEEDVVPSCHKHFKAREKNNDIAQRRYTAPPNQAGLRLASVIGYNGHANDNMFWSPDTGLFVYTSGSVVVMEDLSTGEQKHLHGHLEEISTIAVQNDHQVLASVSAGGSENTQCQLCVWDINQRTCKKTVYHHKYQVTCMAYSRDDRFLLTVGDYRDREIAVWVTSTYTIITKAKMGDAVHSVKWDPYTVNEFASVGENATLCFWLLEETNGKTSLSVHEAEVPEDLLRVEEDDDVAFTSLEYTGDSTLFVALSNGKVSAWDTRHNSCFMHWSADTAEIGAIESCSSKLLTGSVAGNLRLWLVTGVNGMKEPGVRGRIPGGKGLLMEDEMTLDGAVTAVRFDENLEMGIVGTSFGTLWYINWVERTSIRLISGHAKKVTGIAMTTGGLMATSSEDGSVRVWVLQNKEQALQFQVKDQACTCVAFAPDLSQRPSLSLNENISPDPPVVPALLAGYRDGTVRLFNVNSVEMVLKLRPHSVAVKVVAFSADGGMILSGASDGVIAVSSQTSGMTVRVINDHRGAPITDIHVAHLQGADADPLIRSPQMWLACSADRRVSIWSSDWSRDYCDLVDWLSFPAPAFTPEGERAKGKSQYSVLPASLARFSPEEQDMILYTGYGMNKCIQFYSLVHRKVVRTISLTHWACTLDICANNSLIAVGINERLLKLIDYYEGSFQDYTTHDDAVSVARFTLDGSQLVSVAHGQILVWDVTL